MLLLCLAAIVVAGCSDDSLCPDRPGGGDFEVVVLSWEGRPIEGARIEWSRLNACCGVTDSDGRALLPDEALGRLAQIYADNHFPIGVESLSQTAYILGPTPQKLVRIGHVDGMAIRFDGDMIMTLSIGGYYSVYARDGTSLTKIFGTRLSSHNVSDFEFRGDTLWYGTDMRGIYAVALDDPLDPRILLHMDVPHRAHRIAVTESLVFAGDIPDRRLSVYRYELDGIWQEIFTVGDLEIEEMVLRSHYLIVVEPGYYSVFDVEDPYDLDLVLMSTESGYRTGCFMEDQLVLLSGSYDPTGVVDYKVIDISDPLNPYCTGYFTSDSRLLGFIDENTAIGLYRKHGRVSSSRIVAVLRGSTAVGFGTVAIGIRYDVTDMGLHAPPYFVFGQEVWRLEDR
jgi:hypothetical protein